MIQTPKNKQSTKGINVDRNTQDFEPSFETSSKNQHHIYATTQHMNHILQDHRLYTDLTGLFPVYLITGSNYIMILYLYDINGIIAEPLKNRTSQELSKAYNKWINIFQMKGILHSTHWLDNEAPSEIININKNYNITHQLTPPHMHRINAAERAIRTWKSHFITGLASTNSMFPLTLWDKLIDQDNITLNLLRKSRIHPNFSAHMELEGVFDYNKTPLAPPGCKVMVHKKIKQRSTWSPWAQP